LGFVDKPEKRKLPEGLNIFGYFREGVGSGVETGAVANLRAIESAKIPFQTCNVIPFFPKYFGVEKPRRSPDLRNPYFINLFQINADQTPTIYWKAKKKKFENHYNIGFWYWENEHFPKKWFPAFRCLHEIWTASEFTRAAVQEATALPVCTIPPPVHFEVPEASRSAFSLPKNRFIFLFVFDFRGFFERKNPLGLIRAFQQAFPDPSSEALLVIKCFNSHYFPAERQRLLESGGRHPSVRVIDEDIGQTGTRQLIQACDVYVSLHRSEGFGLTIAEAMSLAKPVIVTGYSGNMQFTTPQNSFLVNHKLVRIQKTIGPYEKGWHWAEPSIDHAAHWMKHVFFHRKEALEKGQAAQADIRANLSPERIGELIKKRMDEILASVDGKR